MLGVPFLDELGSGLPVVGAPALERELFATFAGLTFAVFTLPQLVSIAIEAKLQLFATRYARRKVLRAALGVYGLGLAAAALTHTRLLFVLAWTMSFLASGIAVATAEAELMDRDPEHRERSMAEWTLAASLGDLSVPLFLAAAAALGRDYRAAWFAASALFFFWAVLVGRRRSPLAGSILASNSDERAGAHEEDEARPRHASLRALLRATWRNRPLYGWLLGASLCSLMDEPLAAFSALWMHQRFGSELAVSAGVGAFTLGGFAGLLLLHRLLATMAPRTLLVSACFGSVVTLVGWLNTDSLTTAVIALALLGAFAATHYPLATAAAYRALPNDSGAVSTLTQFFGPLDLVIPLALGIIADQAGVNAAVTGLLFQPLALLVIVAFVRRARAE